VKSERAAGSTDLAALGLEGSEKDCLGLRDIADDLSGVSIAHEGCIVAPPAHLPFFAFWARIGSAALIARRRWKSVAACVEPIPNTACALVARASCDSPRYGRHWFAR
jgi:hypothetical protein